MIPLVLRKKKKTFKSNAAQEAELCSLRAGLHFFSFFLSPRDSFRWHTRNDTFHNFLQLLRTIPPTLRSFQRLFGALVCLCYIALLGITFSKVCSDKYQPLRSIVREQTRRILPIVFPLGLRWFT